MVFLFEVLGGALHTSFDIEGADFFAVDHLPQSSEDRMLKAQIKQRYQKAITNDLKVHVD